MAAYRFVCAIPGTQTYTLSSELSTCIAASPLFIISCFAQLFNAAADNTSKISDRNTKETHDVVHRHCLCCSPPLNKANYSSHLSVPRYDGRLFSLCCRSQRNFSFSGSLINFSKLRL